MTLVAVDAMSGQPENTLFPTGYKRKSIGPSLAHALTGARGQSFHEHHETSISFLAITCSKLCNKLTLACAVVPKVATVKSVNFCVAVTTGTCAALEMLFSTCTGMAHHCEID